MKRRALFLVLLMLGLGVQAQVIIKHGENGKQVDFGDDKLVKMLFDVDGKNNGDDIEFVRQSGDILVFDVDEIYAMKFAENYSTVEDVKRSGETAIAYDADAYRVYIVNVKETNGAICIFNAEGKSVKRAEGVSVSVDDLPDGLYVVTYNMELNAKIVKK